MDLGEGGGAVEPVECLGDGYRVGARVGKSGALGGSGGGFRVGDGPLERRAHGVDGLDRDDTGAGRGEEAGELAGTGREVDDGATGAEVEAADQPVDGRIGIAGPALLVVEAALPNPCRAVS